MCCSDTAAGLHAAQQLSANTPEVKAQQNLGALLRCVNRSVLSRTAQ